MINLTVLKGAIPGHFCSNRGTTKLVQGRKGIIKNPGTKELGQTISDKARKRIPIVAKLKYRAKISLPVYFFIFYFWRRAEIEYKIVSEEVHSTKTSRKGSKRRSTLG